MIQTNANLVTDEFADFFKQNDFIVSVSLDGDESSHNKNRFVNSNIGSFDVVCWNYGIIMFKSWYVFEMVLFFDHYFKFL